MPTRTKSRKSNNNSLPHFLAECFHQMSDEEKMEFADALTWKEIEEWKATVETLRDRRLMASYKRGLNDMAAGRVSEFKPRVRP